MSDVYVTFGGDTASLEASLAVAKAQVSAVTTEMRSLARQMQTTGASADSELGQKMHEAAKHLVEAKEAAKGLGEELRHTHEEGGHFAQIREFLQGMTSPLRAVRQNLGEIAEMFIAAFAVERLAEFVDGMAELGERVVRAGAEMGVTAEQASQLSGIAKLTGTDFTSLEHDIERFQTSLTTAGSETSRTHLALQALGLTAREFVGVPIPEQIGRLAEAVSRFADGGNKTAAVMALMGRDGAEMLPFLDRGREGMQELMSVMQRTGAVMSNEMAESFEKTKEHISEMSLAWEGLKERIYSAINPAIDSLVVWLTRMMEALKPDEIRAAVIEITALIGSALKALGDFAIMVSGLFKNAIGDAQELKATLKEMAAGTAGGALVGGITGGPLGAVVGGLGGLAVGATLGPYLNSKLSGQQPATPSTKDQIANFNSAIDKMTSELTSLVRKSASPSSGEAAGPHSGKPQVGAIDTNAAQQAATAAKKAAADALAAAQAAAAGQIKAAQDEFRQKAALYSDELKNKQITESQKLALTLEALKEELAAEEAAIGKELALNGISLAQRQRLLNQKAEVERQYAAEVQKAQQEAADATHKKWQNAFSTINSAFESQISGLLRGTESWATAFKKVLAELITDVIRFYVDWALKHAETIAGNILGLTTQTTATAAAQTAQTAAVASGTAAQKAINATSIQGDAGRAAAGAYAATTSIPIIGPVLAPAIAAAAYAGTMAFSAFDIGAYDIPKDQLALIHQQELVMPAAQANAFRSFLENGNPSGAQAQRPPDVHNHYFNFPISAMDSQDVARFFKKNAKPLVKALQHAVQTGAHHGLAHIGG